MPSQSATRDPGGVAGAAWALPGREPLYQGGRVQGVRIPVDGAGWHMAAPFREQGRQRCEPAGGRCASNSERFARPLEVASRRDTDVVSPARRRSETLDGTRADWHILGNRRGSRPGV